MTWPATSLAHGVDPLSVEVSFYEDWGSGGCAEGVVTNHGTAPSAWEVDIGLEGSVTDSWDAELLYAIHSHHEGSTVDHTWRVVGGPGNQVLQPGTSTTFGFCIDRTQEPEAVCSDAPVAPPVLDDPELSGGEPHVHPAPDSGFIDLATFGSSEGSHHTGDDGLVGGRTAITTEALLAYNNLRRFVGLAPATMGEIGEWAFANTLTNNTQAWGNDLEGVGLWYAMQGAKVGWMADDKFDPQAVADIQRTARLGAPEDAMALVAAYDHEGFAEYLTENGFVESFINTLKMEPHYAGWMHDRAHGWLSIEGVAIAHDVNHLTVLSHDQMQPFMNDTWDWPQWPALDVSHARVLEYFQSMVVLGDPLGDHLGYLPGASTPISEPEPGPAEPGEAPVEEGPVEEEPAQQDPPAAPSENDPGPAPMEDHEGHGGGGQAPADGSTLQLVAATTSVSVWVDSETGLAYVQDQGGQPILITRSDDYWEGDVPLTRGGATIMAAARDELGRLRVLDGGGLEVYAWILNESGFFVGEEGPSASSIADKESLFQVDIDGDGVVGAVEATTPPAEPVMPPMEDHEGHDEGSHGHMAPPAASGDYVDITTWGTFHGSNHNSEGHELVGGRTAITTEAHEAYNNLRAFLGLPAVTIEGVGEWAFDESLTNNSQAWGNDLQGVGLWYAMQGAKVGWITDEAYDPQILADIQRTARTVSGPVEMKAAVMDMVRQYGHAGYADYLEQYGIVDTFINTLKMEPHYGGWMHGRTHGFRSIEGVAINHDVNHLTVLSWDQMQPFMNDTFDWPQWNALDVSDSGVIEYFQSMVSLGNPVGQNLESASAPAAPPAADTPGDPPADPPSEPEVPSEPDPTAPALTGLSVEVGGELWWGGFTAELVVRNETGAYLDSWSFRFTSSHRITGDPWGVTVETLDLGNGFYEHRLRGFDWGQSISANGSVTVGFNASQGSVLGNAGSLNSTQLFDGGSPRD